MDINTAQKALQHLRHLEERKAEMLNQLDRSIALQSLWPEVFRHGKATSFAAGNPQKASGHVTHRLQRSHRAQRFPSPFISPHLVGDADSRAHSGQRQADANLERDTEVTPALKLMALIPATVIALGFCSALQTEAMPQKQFVALTLMQQLELHRSRTDYIGSMRCKSRYFSNFFNHC